jgi:hypothetical protein
MEKILTTRPEKLKKTSLKKELQPENTMVLKKPNNVILHASCTIIIVKILLLTVNFSLKKIYVQKHILHTCFMKINKAKTLINV